MLTVPDSIIEYFNKPIIAHVGTHNHQLKAWASIGFGVKVSADKQTVTVLMPAGVAAKTLENLQSNGRIAVNFTEPASHESYQFKGSYLSHRESTEEEIALQADFMERFNKLFEMFGRGPAYFGNIKYKPSIAISFTPEQIYTQTPGPGAGKQLV